MPWNHNEPCAFLVPHPGIVARFCFAGCCRGVEHIARPHDRARYGREDQLFNEKKVTLPETPLSNE